jgi:hypothetical protein
MRSGFMAGKCRQWKAVCKKTNRHDRHGQESMKKSHLGARDSVTEKGFEPKASNLGLGGIYEISMSRGRWSES